MRGTKQIDRHSMNFFKKLFGSADKSSPQPDHVQEKKAQDDLFDILWNFADEKYPNLESFSKALKDYNDEIEPDNKLIIDRVFHPSQEITVRYTYWGEDEDGDDDQFEDDLTVTTTHAQGFRANEFLFLVHNKICEQKMDEDATYFEGIRLVTEDASSLVFYLNLGS